MGDEALSLLQSESTKNLNESKSVSKSLSIVVTKDQTPKKEKEKPKTVSDDMDSDDFVFPETTSPTRVKNSNGNANKRSQSTSDDDSNDSILDWLDEPREKKVFKKRQPLLPKRKLLPNKLITPKDTKTESKIIKSDLLKKAVIIDKKFDDNFKQWQDWLGLESEDVDFMHIAEEAAKSSLPDDWEKVNDNLYHDIRTNERTMTHPLLVSAQAKLKTARKDKISKAKE